jgi:hypothetical protein
VEGTRKNGNEPSGSPLVLAQLVVSQGGLMFMKIDRMVVRQVAKTDSRESKNLKGESYALLTVSKLFALSCWLISCTACAYCVNTYHTE